VLAGAHLNGYREKRLHDKSIAALERSGLEFEA
jgi:hypothetical protein